MTNTFYPERIASGLGPYAGKIAVEVVEQTASTNTDLLRRVHALSSPTCLLAVRQTAGRGRNGREWQSGDGTSLTFSLAWFFSRPESDLGGLSLVTGVALAQALHGLGVPVTLKWPNDILREGKKLAGILIERPTGGNRAKTGENRAVIGVGLNLLLPEELEARIGQPAAEARWLAGMDKNDLMAALLNKLAESFVSFDRQGLTAFIQPWNALHAYNERQVTLLRDGQPQQSGRVIGIDAHGRLMLETEAGNAVFSAGDISLRVFDEQGE
ncbi:MAG: biotin--[acetyl-CoA-carboxylase] ligase [Burkholderiaceae bacterium]|jgi:BirA family biotin operon repressor/biotin-[acetyl-CoA-carboxylase] ligase|nr:biotin--[acetyl-CoA-carboxylase] ligase [Burkholderiaceae bacterium]